MKYKLLLITLFACGLGWGQDFNGTYSFASTIGNVASLSYNGSAITNLTVGALTKTGVTTSSSSGNSRASGWGTGSTDAGAAGGSIDLNKYFEFTITADSGYTISNPTLTYGVGRSGTGTRRFEWRWSVDSYGSALSVGTVNGSITHTSGILETPDANSGYTGNVITTSTSNQTTITFRFYAYGAEINTGTGGLQGNLTFGGTLVANGSSASTTYTTTWSNSAPTASIDAIINGDLDTTADLVCKDLTINSGKTLTIGAGKKLTVSGNLINNGTIIFKSDVNGTAMFDVFNGTQSGTGVVTVERFIPSGGKRAFRLLSPAVTTTNFISNNWQLGTHITGSTTGANGFDITESGNPSMYTYNNLLASGSGWTPIANTNATNLTAGVGYRVLVRGDRAVNLNSNSNGNMNAATTLSATGTLRTGTVTLNSSSTPAINTTTNPTTAGFSLVGNPYQSAVDWHLVTKSGIEDTYYAWAPNMGSGAARGNYVAYNVTTGNSGGGSVGQFIQPGQAFFVKNTTLGTAGTLTFQEAHKATTSANVFRTAITPTLAVALYDPNELAIGAYPIDATKAVFSSEYTNELGLGDAAKLEAAGENIAWFRNNTKLAIDAAAPATTSDELLMKTMRLGANKNYTFKIETTNFDSALTPYLVDNFLNTQTEIATSQAFLASFATTSNQASYSENRFKIVFQNRALNTDDFVKNIKIYPNPAQAGGSFYIDGITEASVSVYNVVGQNIPVTVMSQGNAIQVTPKAGLSKGVYLVSITVQGMTKQVKWIVE